MSGDAHADRTAKFQHAIKHLDCDFHLTQTTCVFTRTQRIPNDALVASNRRFEAWFKTGLFWVTQTIGILLPGEGGLDAEMKKTGRVSNRFRVQLKGVETL